MNVIELADKAGMCYVDAHRTITCTESALHKFYTLARADLEADLVKHRELLAHHLSVIDPLRAENASLGKRHAALLESHAHLEAENAKLKSELVDLRKRFTAAADQMQAYADHPLNALRDGQKAGYASSALIARAALGEQT